MKDHEMSNTVRLVLSKEIQCLRDSLFSQCHTVLIFHERVRCRGEFSRFFGGRVAGIVYAIKDALTIVSNRE
jgi:hypothetical protein